MVHRSFTNWRINLSGVRFRGSAHSFFSTLYVICTYIAGPSFDLMSLAKDYKNKNTFYIHLISQLFHIIMLAKCVLSTMELNWNQRFTDKNTKLKICRQVLTSSTQQQNSSFYVVERTRTVLKCTKMKDARAKRAKLLFFIVKYENL